MDCIQEIFADKYHDLKLTQKLSAGQTGYHSTKAVVLTRNISYAINNLALAATADHIHVDQLMAKRLQLTEMNNIIGYHIKHLYDT